MGYLGDKKLSKKTRKRVRKPISWAMCPAFLMQALVASLTTEGLAVLFGVTSDGGTLSVYVYDDGDKDVFYIRGGESFYDAFAQIVEEYSNGDAETVLGAPPKTKGAAEPDGIA